MSRAFFLCCLLVLAGWQLTAVAKPRVKALPTKPADAMQCVAFSPYVGNLNPDFGAPPSPALIDTLLDSLVKNTRFRCIMTYGVLNGLEHTFAAAQARKMKVIAILWLDKDKSINSQSISKGIAVARQYPDTIIKLSCGSEVRTRNGNGLDTEIIRCIDALHEAGIKQPITTIDTWWEWCNRSTTCQPTGFEARVDWIGINVFPWWENRHAAIHKCTTAEHAADFHIARINEVRKTYPGKPVVLTEFGWPNAPEGGTLANLNDGQQCGIAGKNNQILVVNSTLKKLAQHHLSGHVFEAFSEQWKPTAEGDFGRYWGICSGEPPYDCDKAFK